MSDVQLHLGDCLEALRGMEPGSVDCVVTDPPFGVRSDEWDDMGEQEFNRFCMEWLSQCRRICGTLVAFYASGGSFARLCEFVYPRVRPLVWHKPLGSQYAGASECRLWFAYEPIVHCYRPESWSVVKPKGLRVGELLRAAREAKGLSRGAVDMVIRGKKTGLCYRWEEAACLPTPEQTEKLTGLLRLNGDFHEALAEAVADKEDTMEKAAEKAAEKTDVFSYRTVTNGVHPCEKPLGLMCDLIECLTEPGDTILDPFAGSGTTLLACLRTGRNAIGIERDPTYFAIAQKRIAAAQRDVVQEARFFQQPTPDLFGEDR